MVTEDKDLAMKAELRATGATVHRVRGELNAYRALCSWLGRHPVHLEFGELDDARQECERRLRFFVANGHFPVDIPCHPSDNGVERNHHEQT